MTEGVNKSVNRYFNRNGNSKRLLAALGPAMLGFSLVAMAIFGLKLAAATNGQVAEPLTESLVGHESYQGRAAVFIAYSLEDTMFNRQLLQAQQQLAHQQTVAQNIRFVTDLSAFNLTDAAPLQFNSETKNLQFQEFSANNRHYHAMRVANGFLLLDSTETAVVSRVLADIVLILSIALVPGLIMAYLIAKMVSAHALRPFTELSKNFGTSQASIDALQGHIVDKLAQKFGLSFTVTPAAGQQSRQQIEDRAWFEVKLERCD